MIAYDEARTKDIVEPVSIAPHKCINIISADFQKKQVVFF